MELNVNSNTLSQSTPFPYPVIFVVSIRIFELHLKNKIPWSCVLLCNARVPRLEYLARPPGLLHPRLIFSQLTIERTHYSTQLTGTQLFNGLKPVH